MARRDDDSFASILQRLLKQFGVSLAKYGMISETQVNAGLKWPRSVANTTAHLFEERSNLRGKIDRELKPVWGLEITCRQIRPVAQGLRHFQDAISRDWVYTASGMNGTIHGGNRDSQGPRDTLNADRALARAGQRPFLWLSVGGFLSGFTRSYGHSSTLPG